MNCTTSTCGCEATARTNGHARTGAPTAEPAARNGHADAADRRPRVFRAPANVIETAERFQITLDIPGASRDAIDIQFHEGVLRIAAAVAPRTPAGARPVLGEFGVGDYRREFRIGEDVHADAIAARYEAGVLTLDLPKATKAGPRRVAVTGR